MRLKRSISAWKPCLFDGFAGPYAGRFRRSQSRALQLRWLTDLAGIECRPARCAARQRHSPTTISYCRRQSGARGSVADAVRLDQTDRSLVQLRRILAWLCELRCTRSIDTERGPKSPATSRCKTIRRAQQQPAARSVSRNWRWRQRRLGDRQLKHCAAARSARVSSTAAEAGQTCWRASAPVFTGSPSRAERPRPSLAVSCRSLVALVFEPT